MPAQPPPPPPPQEKATLARWLKQHGARVAKGERICEIETANAAVEMPAPADGVLHHLVRESDLVDAGTLVARID